RPPGRKSTPQKSPRSTRGAAQSPDETFRSCRSSAAWRPRAAMARRSDVEARRGDCRGDTAELRALRVSLPAERSILVSGPRLCHVNGLAFLRIHEFRTRLPHTRIVPYVRI